MRLLIVEDEKKVAGFIKKGLEEETYAVDVAYDGEEGFHLAELNQYDMIILDLMLPKMDGLEVLTRLRDKKVNTPILLLTAKDAVEDKVTGLNKGADDYLTKPFAPKELSARIRALLRRSRTSDTPAPDMAFGDLEVIPDQGVIRKAGVEIHLTKTEFRLLVELASAPGKVFSRESLLEKVWGYGYFGDGRLVDVHIRRLRTKIENDPADPQHVVTVRGLGYKLQT